MSVQDLKHIPDILECLAQLSSDEVPTPPKLANAMLDLLPDEVWTNPDYRWCDPCSKSGAFLREIARRLLFEGLVEWEPDFEKRREHVFRNMIFGCGITELTGIVSRRTVYYSSHATNEYAVIHMDSDDGNIPFVRAEHAFIERRCTICGAPEDLERGPGRENYAYAFLHKAFPTKEMKDMKFDVIVGNPPYQIDSDGNTRTKPIYQLFVEKAIEMDPRYVLMITPSRWFAGGLGLEQYRARMLKDHRLARVVDYPQSKDCFPGVKIRGGVSYFLWDRAHTGGCTIQTVREKSVGQPMTRDLDAYNVFVRFNEGVGIIDKVGAEGYPTMDQRVSSLVPFGLRAKFRDYVDPGSPGAIALHVMGREIKWIDLASVTNNQQWVPKWKTLLHAAYGEDHDGPYSVIANPLVAAPESACTETYLVIGTFDTEQEAENLAAFLRTRFARFLIWLRMNTQHVRGELFAFVPDVDWTRRWTDEDLFDHFDLTDAEIAVIEANIREMTAPVTLTA